jgi:hypothetical protein
MDLSNLWALLSWQTLLDLALARLDWANFLGVLGGLFMAATLYMKTMVRLRLANIASNIFFVGYGYLAWTIPTLVMYAVLLPLNLLRLYQLRELIRKVRAAATGDLSMDWLKPFMTKRNYKKGAVLFRKGDRAMEMFYTVSGKYLVTELGVELPPGRIMGELGFLTPDNRRTQTVECLEAGEALTVTYDKVLELYYQDPEFGFYFLRLVSDRLLQNIARLEREIEAHHIKAEIRIGAEAGQGIT